MSIKGEIQRPKGNDEDDYSDSGYGKGYLARRRAKKHKREGMEKQYADIDEKRLKQRERLLELKEKERALRQREREYQHPIRTKAMRRAEKLGEKFLSQGEQTAQNIPKEGARQLTRAVRRQRQLRIRSGFTEGTQGGRVRLPVFAQGTPGFAEQVANDFGAKAPQEILPATQPQEFFTNKSAELFGESQQVNMLGNGNKKKQVRYY